MKSLRVVALLSGGKDSLFNLYMAVKEGHEVVAIANLKPPDNNDNDELDSYMYQTVGHQAITYIAQALEKPLFRAEITKTAKVKDLNYVSDEEDEVEHLYNLLKDIKEKHGIQFDAISVGAIASTYQTLRCEDVCRRLDLKCLAYLWNKNQHELLQAMIDNNFNAILIKVACLGLNEKHLGLNIKEMQDHLSKLNSEYGCSMVGEGGEFETLVLDCPLFKKDKIVLDTYDIVCHSKDPFAPVYYIRPKDMYLIDKLKSTT